LCVHHKKKLVIYISMGFGNPYGDEWSFEIVQHWIKMLHGLDIGIFAISDTIGVSTPDNITYIYESLIPSFKDVEIGAHFHTRPDKWYEKLEAAVDAGCRRFDGAIRGFGGCPMAKDDLTGNMATENMVSYLQYNEMNLGLKQEELNLAIKMAGEIFPA